MSQRAYERAYYVDESQGIRFKSGMEIVIKCARTAIDTVFYIRLRSLVQSSCSVFLHLSYLLQAFVSVRRKVRDLVVLTYAGIL